MTILARIARFLFWLFVLSWSMWLLRHLVGRVLRNASGAASLSPDQNAAPSGRRLVRDPICGMHVDETLSIPLREGGELHHFCSIACRDAFAVNVRKFAANG